MNRRIQSRCTPDIAECTSPLHKLQGKSVLLLSDIENLRYGARDLGFCVRFNSLASRLATLASSLQCHAFLSSSTGKSGYHFSKKWHIHLNPIECVRERGKWCRKANADNVLLFKSGAIIAESTANIVVVASGDGDLVQSMAHCINESDNKLTIMTLSLAGSTSSRLDASKNRLVSTNIELGKDLLSVRRSQAAPCNIHTPASLATC